MLHVVGANGERHRRGECSACRATCLDIVGSDFCFSSFFFCPPSFKNEGSEGVGGIRSNVNDAPCRNHEAEAETEVESAAVKAVVSSP